MIGTNSIAQGDNRIVGFDRLVNQGNHIIAALTDWPWPGSAGVTVTQIWLFKGNWNGVCLLNNLPIQRITTFLTPDEETSSVPHPLISNLNRTFRGTEIKGSGFTLDIDEAQRLLESEPRNSEVIFPYITGEDLNSRPDQSASRMVINFHEWDYDTASQYEACFKIVTEKVKPYRDTITKQIHEPDYWKFWDRRLESYAQIKDMTRVLVRARVGNMHSMAFLPVGMIFSDKILVFECDSDASFAIMQSSLHEVWARKYSGASLRTDMCYSTKFSFDAFPFPVDVFDSSVSTERMPIHRKLLDDIGSKYYEHRRQIMLVRQEGLTTTYNRFHDADERSADIARLRDLHVEMDRAVAAAYGWDDLALGHGFHQTQQGVRFTLSESARREVLSRLLELNHRRYEEEQAAAKVIEEEESKVKKPKGRKKKTSSGGDAPGGPAGQSPAHGQGTSAGQMGLW